MGDLMIFNDKDLINVVSPHKDTLLIIAVIADFDVSRIMVDKGSVADILYYHTFQKVNFIDEMLGPIVHSLTRFTGDSMCVKGGIHLPFMIKSKLASKVINVEFLVVYLRANYNVVLRRPSLHRLQSCLSTFYQVIKFLQIMGLESVREIKES
ncbi:hypothetical protein NE237_029078 [Protea cynaroides]|uniref:Uncharacterized protein n=1 Tax=Protea cynaroides TaxID=273540 RepID=A0A9Q0JUF4_9MAGN|nr:hypothetical protein NE237_029078 [Protea cynaroides]